MNNNGQVLPEAENVQELEKFFEAIFLSNSGQRNQPRTQTLNIRAIKNLQKNTDLELANKKNNFFFQLKELNVSSSKLFQIPTEICYLKYLTVLNLSNNYLDSLPNEIGKLCNLVTLQLSCNKLHGLPKTLRHIQQLNSLDLSHNEFLEVPDVLHYGLTMLKILDLSYNKISKFNNPPACASKLVILGLSNNALKQIPSWIFENAYYLQTLDISVNQLCFDTEPVNLCHSGVCESLQFLNIENCNYSCANSQILSFFKNLKILQLGNKTFLIEKRIGKNYFGNLEMNIFKNLNVINYLYLQNVQLATLPPDFGSLKNIIILDLSNNLLSWLPEDFCNLAFLKTLYLTSNQLLFLPENIGNLVSLKQIHLGNNKLEKIPESFYDLSNLEFVDFYNNKIEKIDPKLFKKENLKGIDVGLNCLPVSFTENDVHPDEIRELYDCLKNSFRKTFGILNSRSDLQMSELLKAADEISSDSSACSAENIISLSESEQCPNFEDLLVDTSNLSSFNDHEVEDWEKSSCEIEKDDFYDPNDIFQRSRRNLWSLEFRKNYCPADYHVPSFIKTHVRNLKSTKKDIEEGQFDSD